MILDTRGRLTRILREDGWEVAEAENGRVALDRLAVIAPRLVLLDLMMPEMDGFRVRRRDPPATRRRAIFP